MLYFSNPISMSEEIETIDTYDPKKKHNYFKIITKDGSGWFVDIIGTLDLNKNNIPVQRYIKPEYLWYDMYLIKSDFNRLSQLIENNPRFSICDNIDDDNWFLIKQTVTTQTFQITTIFKDESYDDKNINDSKLFVTNIKKLNSVINALSEIKKFSDESYVMISLSARLKVCDYANA